MKLTPVMQRYIVHWGEMGSRWGVNRSVAQIHALLYLSPQPLHADEIAETLGIAECQPADLPVIGGGNGEEVAAIAHDRRANGVAQALEALQIEFGVKFFGSRKAREGIDPGPIPVLEDLKEALSR